MRRIALALLAAVPAVLFAATPAAASDAGTYAVGGTARQWVNVRSGPSTTAPSVGSLSAGQAVRVECQDVGSNVTGPGGATTLWDRLGNGRYVSHTYIKGVVGVPVRCEDLPVTAVARQWVNVRSGPSATASSVGSLSGGQAVTILCQETGSPVAGPAGATTLWNRIGEGRYVSHSFVKDVLGTPNKCNTPIVTVPTAPVVPAPKPGLTAEQTTFMTLVAAPAMHNFREYKVPASVIIAQAILESGWGRGDIPRTANNYFGMKCPLGKATGTAVGCRNFPTRECDATGCHPSVESFKVYNSTLDSLRDHSLTLSSMKRYSPAFAHSGNPNQFAAAVHKAGYATDPNYTSLLTGLMSKYDLYRYDR
jgi:flagellar protein FlgJ